MAEAAEHGLLDLDLKGLTALMAELGHPAWRARQVWRQIWQRGVVDPLEMSDLPRALREQLAERGPTAPQALETQTSEDGSTTKALLPLADGELIETVLIRHDPLARPSAAVSPTTRRTVCLSTQAGCAMGCTFCATGAQGFRRQLSVGEVLAQALLARDWARDEGGELTHVVFMGMGEPLANYDAVSAALARLTDADGFGLSPRRITVSTVGLPAQIRRLAEDHPQVNLAVSLHAADAPLRRRLVPVPPASPQEIVAAAREHSERTGRRVTFEYVLLAGVNDSRPQARALAERITGIRCQVNLIPFNPSPGVEGRRPSRRATLGFQQALAERGIAVNVRVEKGRDIAAACGQLRGDRVRRGRPNPEPADADSPPA